jgi:hypothetical protein
LAGFLWPSRAFQLCHARFDIFDLDGLRRVSHHAFSGTHFHGGWRAMCALLISFFFDSVTFSHHRGSARPNSKKDTRQIFAELLFAPRLD